MKKWDELFLKIVREIYKQVAARQNVKFGKGRIHSHILLCENNHFTNGFIHPVIAAVIFDKVSAQALWGYIGGDVGWVDAVPCFLTGVAIQIGGKYLERKILSPI